VSIVSNKTGKYTTPEECYNILTDAIGGDITLSQEEQGSLKWLSGWLSGWSEETLNDMLSIIGKLKGEIITEAAPWAQELISIPDAAEILGVDPSAIRHAIARGSQGLQPNVDYTRIGSTWVLHKNAVLRLGGRPAEAKWQAYLKRRFNNQE